MRACYPIGLPWFDLILLSLVPVPFKKRNGTPDIGASSFRRNKYYFKIIPCKSMQVCEHRKWYEMLQTPMVWCSIRLHRNTQEGRPMAESFADGPRAQPGHSGRLQCGAGCDPCLAGCHQFLAGRDPPERSIKRGKFELNKPLVKTCWAGILSGFSNRFASRHVERSPLSLGFLSSMQIWRIGPTDPTDSHISRVDRWILVETHWNYEIKHTASHLSCIFGEIFRYVWITWNQSKATLSTCHPTCTWKDRSQLHHHPSRHRSLGDCSPPMLETVHGSGEDFLEVCGILWFDGCLGPFSAS